MIDKIEEWGYRLCWRGDWISSLWCKIWFRWYCPYPIGGKWRACSCVEAKQCGCDNQKHYMT